MQVELKDKGITLEFPDSMSKDDMKAAIRKRFYSDAATKTTSLKDAILNPIKRIIPATLEQVNAGIEGIKLGQPEQRDPLDIDTYAATGNKLLSLGGYLFSPLGGPAQALVGEPSGNVARSLGASEPIAQNVEQAVTGGVMVGVPIHGINKAIARRAGPGFEAAQKLGVKPTVPDSPVKKMVREALDEVGKKKQAEAAKAKPAPQPVQTPKPEPVVEEFAPVETPQEPIVMPDQTAPTEPPLRASGEEIPIQEPIKPTEVIPDEPVKAEEVQGGQEVGKEDVYQPGQEFMFDSRAADVALHGEEYVKGLENRGLTHGAPKKVKIVKVSGTDEQGRPMYLVEPYVGVLLRKDQLSPIPKTPPVPPKAEIPQEIPTEGVKPQVVEPAKKEPASGYYPKLEKKAAKEAAKLRTPEEKGIAWAREKAPTFNTSKTDGTEATLLHIKAMRLAEKATNKLKDLEATGKANVTTRNSKLKTNEYKFWQAVRDEARIIEKEEYGKVTTEPTQAKVPTPESNLDLASFDKMDRLKAIRERFPDLSMSDSMKLSVGIDEIVTGTKGAPIQPLQQPSVAPKNWEDHIAVSNKIKAREEAARQNEQVNAAPPQKKLYPEPKLAKSDTYPKGLTRTISSSLDDLMWPVDKSGKIIKSDLFTDAKTLFKDNAKGDLAKAKTKIAVNDKGEIKAGPPYDEKIKFLERGTKIRDKVTWMEVYKNDEAEAWSAALHDADGNTIHVDPKYVGLAKQLYPDVKFFIDNEKLTGPIAAKSGGETVALIMPYIVPENISGANAPISMEFPIDAPIGKVSITPTNKVRQKAPPKNVINEDLYTQIDTALKTAKEFDKGDSSLTTDGLYEKYGKVIIKSPSGKHTFTVPDTAYHLDKLRTTIGKMEGKNEGITLGSGLGGLQPHYEKAIDFVKDKLASDKKWWTTTREFIEDDWIRVKKLVQQKGANVTETNNPYEAEIRYWGRIGTRLEDAVSKVTAIDKDILDTSKKIGASDKSLAHDVNQYLHAKHAPDYNAKHGEKAAGMTDAEAAQIISDTDSSAHVSEIKRIAKQVKDMSDQTLDVLLEGGVIDQTLYDKLRAMYPEHVPLNRVMEGQDIVDVLINKGFNVQGSGLKRAKGSERQVADIVTNAAANLDAALSRAEKNIVDNHTLRFARDNNYFNGLFEEIKPKAIGKDFNDNIILQKINDPNVLPLRENGKQVYLKINDPKLASALRGINRHKVEGWIKGAAVFTRFYAGLMTRFNPEFSVPNKIRDLQEMAVYLASKKEVSGKAVFKTVAKDPSSMKDIVEYVMGKDTPGAKLYHQMKMDGGTTGGLGLSTKQQLQLDIAKIQKINRSNPRKAAKAIIEAVDTWNTIFENSTRLSVYREALAEGVSRNKAAVLAKEASINFNKMGKGSPVSNALWMFSNASVQGSAKMLRAMRNPKVAAGVLAILGGSLAVVSDWNDKVDPKWRDKVNKWDKLNGVNVVIPTTDGSIKYVTVPISWGLKPIKVAFDQIDNITSGQSSDVTDAVSSIFAAIVEGYNPSGGTDAISAITPSILDVPVDIGRNKSWTGGKIKPDWNNAAPESIKYFDSLKDKLSGRLFIKGTKALGEYGIEVSPADLNYAFEQYIGGTGRFAGKSLNTLIGMMEGDVKTKEIPFASRFYRSTPKEEIRESGETFKKLKDILSKQSKEDFYLNQEAALVFDSLKNMDEDAANSRFSEIQESDPRLAEKIINVKKAEDLNLTTTERLIAQLKVDTGARAKYLWSELMSMKESERNAYVESLRSKKIISDKVMEQLQYLKDNNGGTK